MLKEQGGGSGWGGEEETQTWAEALEGAAGPQPRREPLPTGPRPPPWCPRLVPGQRSPEDTFAQWCHKKTCEHHTGSSTSVPTGLFRIHCTTWKVGLREVK